jgi:antitoxin CcdA
MPYVYDQQAPKGQASLSINRDLLSAACESGLDLSAVLEEALVEKVAAVKREHWLQENSEAIAAFDEFIGSAASRNRPA